MNTLIEPTTRSHLTSSPYLRQPIDDNHVAGNYAYQQRSPLEVGGAVCETVMEKENVRVKKRLLAPAKPPMRLEGKRRRGKTSISFCA